jgi:hypothetical protein
MFLTDDQLADLTGLKQPAAQRRWLIREHVPFRVRADGLNRVLAADLAGREQPPPARPRFDAITPAR